MKNKLFKRITAITIILSVICSIFCSTILAKDVSVDSDCVDENCSEDLFSTFSQSPFSLNENQTVTLTDSKETLLSAIKSPDIFSVNGTVTEENTIRTINESFDFSLASKFDAANWAYEAGLITEEEKIDCYCDIIINRNFVNETCLNPAFNTIENYKSSGRISSTLSEKISEALKSPEERLDETQNSSKGLFDDRVYNSTNFGVHYSANSGITQQSAKNVADYLEQLRTTFRNMGFNYPIYEFLITRYQVYLDPNPSTSASNPAAVCNWKNTNSLTCASSITFYNFSSFDINSITSFNKEIKEILAHEYFHAIQCSYNTYYNWFTEACANWGNLVATGTHQIAEPQVNALLQSANSISDSDYKYGAVIFPMTIHELCGGSISIRKIYEYMNTCSNNISVSQFESIINTGIQNAGWNETVATVMRKMSIFCNDISYWYSGSFSAAANYTWREPTYDTLNATDGYEDIGYTLSELSTAYYKIAIPAGYTGRVQVIVTYFNAGGALQIHKYNMSNYEYTYSLVSTNSVNASAWRSTYTYNFDSYQDLSIMITNTKSSGVVFYDFEVTLLDY